jgi:hypothetical protein
MPDAPITYASLSDLTVASTLAAELQLKLGDRASLMNHPAITYVGDIAGSGSSVKKVGIVGKGLDPMAAATDGDSVLSTALTNANVSITVARQALYRQVTDLAGQTWASVGDLVTWCAEDMVGAATLRAQTMICTAGSAFSTVVGTSGAALTVTNIFSAIAALEAVSAPGPFLAVVSPKQLSDFQNSLRSETGALQWIPATADMIAIKGQGYAGSYLGIDFFVSSKVVTSGSDKLGFIISYGAIGYADGTPAPIMGSGGVMYPMGTKMYVEMGRTPEAAISKIVGNYYVGFAELQDGMGVQLQTRAS